MRWMPRRKWAKKDVYGCEKLRGVAKITVIRRCLNGGTQSFKDYPSNRRRTQGTETSKYLEEKKSTEISLVVASERERA